MVKALTIAFCLLASTAFAQDCETLSPNAQAAMHWFVTAETPANQFIITGATRRFAPTTITWRIAGASSTAATNNRRNAIRFFQYLLNAGPCPANVAFVQVPATDPALITFQYATSFTGTMPGTQTPYTVSVNMANSPYESADRVTYERAWVNSNPTRSGSDGAWLMVHEIGHLMTAFWHTSTSGGQLLGLLEKAQPSYCKYVSTVTAEQNAQNPCWEPAPGFWDAMRWIYRHPAGTRVE